MYILTGGAGFIGSVCLSKLNEAGIEDVLVVDELETSSKWKNLVGKAFLDYVHKDDFISAVEQRTLPGKIDGIIHMGACSTTTEQDMDYLMDNNVRFSQKLAEFAVEKGARFIYASSAATYGDGSNGYSDDETAIGGLRPLNRYGYSKQLFDLWCRRRGLLDRAAGLKFFNVYGPNEYHKEGQFSGVYRSFMQMKESGKVRLFKSDHPDYKDGEQKRDFIYVKDCAQVILWLLENPGVNGIFNLGTGKARTWKDLALAVFSAAELPPSIEFTDLPENLAGQYQYFTEAKMEKLAAAGCPMRFTSLEDGVRDYVRNHLLRPNIYC